MHISGRTFRQAIPLLAAAVALAVTGLTAGPAMAQSSGGAPTVSSISISSSSGPDRTYGIGDTIRVLVTFSEEVIPDGQQAVTLDVGGESGQAISQVPIISSTSTEAIAFAYVVKEGDSDTDGVSISANSLSLVSGTLHDADGNDAILDHDALADDNHTRWTASGPPSPLSP